MTCPPCDLLTLTVIQTWAVLSVFCRASSISCTRTLLLPNNAFRPPPGHNDLCPPINWLAGATLQHNSNEFNGPWICASHLVQPCASDHVQPTGSSAAPSCRPDPTCRLPDLPIPYNGAHTNKTRALQKGPQARSTGPSAQGPRSRLHRATTGRLQQQNPRLHNLTQLHAYSRFPCPPHGCMPAARADGRMCCAHGCTSSPARVRELPALAAHPRLHPGMHVRGAARGLPTLTHGCMTHGSPTAA